MEEKEYYNKLDLLHYKKQKAFRTIQEMTPVKEPLVKLLRQNGEIENYEGIQGKKFTYDHTDGSTRTIQLNEKYLLTEQWGKYRTKLYILHEDHPTPLPENPIITIEAFQENIEKANTNSEALKAQASLKKANMEGWAKIIMWTGIAIGGILLVYFMFRTEPTQTTNTIIETIPQTTTILQNITQNGTIL